MVTEKYKSEAIDLDDPEENPFHEDLTALPRILAGMVKRTREAQDDGDKYMPLTAVLIDDLMSGSGPASGYRYNDSIQKLFATSRHSGGGPVILMTQSYKALSRAARMQATHLGVWQVQSTQWEEIRSDDFFWNRFTMRAALLEGELEEQRRAVRGPKQKYRGARVRYLSRRGSHTVTFTDVDDFPAAINSGAAPRPAAPRTARHAPPRLPRQVFAPDRHGRMRFARAFGGEYMAAWHEEHGCLLYTSDAADE